MHCSAARRDLEACLTPGDRSPALRAHLTTCAACRAYAEHLEALELALRAAGQSAPPVDERAFIASVLSRAAAREKGTGTVFEKSVENGASPLSLPRTAGILPALFRCRWFLAAAAAVLVAIGLAAHLLRPGPTATAPPPERTGRVVVTLADPTSVPAEPPPIRCSGVSGFLADHLRRVNERELRDLPTAM